MTREDLEKALKKGQVSFPEKDQQNPASVPELNDLEKMTVIFEVLRRPKYHLTSAPTFTPKHFLEQIQFYDDGTNRRLYLYVNGTWRYTALT